MENLESGSNKIRRWLSAVFLVAAVIAAIYGSMQLSAIDIETEKEPEKDPNYSMPSEEKDRLDILVMGMRGESDLEAKEAGAYLTDTIMVFSYDRITGKASVVSVPRDFYV